ncbi:hypothetical protein SAMN06295888_12211 [Desulfonatronum zhilinae]|nr:hypothetical protein SAMN06295888_12211 [Desulfonatronum zhilinae]
MRPTSVGTRRGVPHSSTDLTHCGVKGISTHTYTIIHENVPFSFRFGLNLIIGAIFLALAVLLGNHILSVLFPMSALGVLLVFAGLQLCMSMLDINVRKDLFVAVAVVGITLASNLAVGFVVGTALAYVLRSDRLKV